MATAVLQAKNRKKLSLPTPTTKAERLLAIVGAVAAEHEIPGRTLYVPNLLRPAHWQLGGRRMPQLVASRWYEHTSNANLQFSKYSREHLERRFGVTYSVDGSPLIGIALTHPVYGEHVHRLLALVAAMMGTKEDANKRQGVTQNEIPRIQASLLRDRWFSISKDLGIGTDAAKQIFSLCTGNEGIVALRSKKIKDEYFVQLSYSAIFIMLRSSLSLFGETTKRRFTQSASRWAMLDYEESHISERSTNSTVRRTAEYIYKGLDATLRPQAHLNDAQCNAIEKVLYRIWLAHPKENEQRIIAKVHAQIKEAKERSLRKVDGARLSTTTFSGGSMTFARGSCANTVWSG